MLALDIAQTAFISQTTFALSFYTDHQLCWSLNSFVPTIVYLDIYFFSPGWPPSAACRPQMSWMITRCARCCLIWSRPTMPLTASSTPPKASVHPWSHLSAMTLISLKLKKETLSLYVCWKGSEFMSGQVLYSPVSVTICCLQPFPPGSSCAVRPSIGLFSIQTCVINLFIIGC